MPHEPDDDKTQLCHETIGMLCGVLARTSTDIAPWTVIKSDGTWYGRVREQKTVIASVQKLL